MGHCSKHGQTELCLNETERERQAPQIFFGLYPFVRLVTSED